MKCKYCGAELKPEDKFCTECGNKVEETRVCPKCGATTTGKYCIECGYDLDSQTSFNQNQSTNTPPMFEQPVKPEQPQAQQTYGGVYMDPTPKKSNKGLIALVVGLAVIVVVGMGVTSLFTTKSNQPTEVIKKEVRKEKDPVDEPSTKSFISTDDFMVIDTFSANESLSNLEKKAKSEGTKNEDGEYEIAGVIDGRDVTYYLEFEDGFTVSTIYQGTDEKDYKEFKKYVLDFLEKNYERDPYQVESGDDEFVYENDNDFLMVITSDDDNSLFIYRSPFMDE